MPNFNFQTTSDAMTTAYSNVESAKTQLDSALKSLQSELDAQIPGWTGAASGAYASVQAQWNDDQRKINNALDNLATALQQANKNYAKTEDVNTGNFPKS